MRTEEQIKSGYWADFHKLSIEALINNLASVTFENEQLKARISQCSKELAKRDAESASKG